MAITISNLDDGQEIMLPYDVNGSATGGGGIQTMAWQIDDGPLIEIPPNGNPPDEFDPFDFTITDNECPLIDIWYLLAVYAWDSQGNLMYEARTFKRIANPVAVTDNGGTCHQ